MSATAEPDPQAASDVSRTQEAILAAYAELIEELGTDDVSFRLIARRAGVGERTVFRNYATRVDLLLATAAWIETQNLPATGLREHLRHASHDSGGDGVVRPSTGTCPCGGRNDHAGDQRRRAQPAAGDARGR